MSGMTVDEVKQYIARYVKEYHIGERVHFKVREKAEDFEPHLAERYQGAKAAYIPYKNPSGSHTGCIDVVASNATSNLDLRRSLNHEILGHHGINILTPNEKAYLLDSIIESRESLTDLWDYVDRHYPDEPLYLKAEEVFCLVVEDIEPSMHQSLTINQHHLADLNVNKLRNLALEMAASISGGAEQKTFLHEDVTYLQYKMEKSTTLVLEDLNRDEFDDDFER